MALMRFHYSLHVRFHLCVAAANVRHGFHGCAVKSTAASQDEQNRALWIQGQADRTAASTSVFAIGLVAPLASLLSHAILDCRQTGLSETHTWLSIRGRVNAVGV